MNSLFNWLLIFLMLIGAFSMAFGVNLKKWYGWVQVLSGFFLGFLMGSTQNMTGNIVMGIFLAVLVAWIGPIVWKRRQL
jgi:hypothetical protein